MWKLPRSCYGQKGGEVLQPNLVSIYGSGLHAKESIFSRTERAHLSATWISRPKARFILRASSGTTSTFLATPRPILNIHSSHCSFRQLEEDRARGREPQAANQQYPHGSTSQPVCIMQGGCQLLDILIHNEGASFVGTHTVAGSKCGHPGQALQRTATINEDFCDSDEVPSAALYLLI